MDGHHSLRDSTRQGYLFNVMSKRGVVCKSSVRASQASDSLYHGQALLATRRRSLTSFGVKVVGVDAKWQLLLDLWRARRLDLVGRAAERRLLLHDRL